VGTQYLDNSENNRKSPGLRLEPGYVPLLVAGHVTLNAEVSLDLGALAGSRHVTLDVHAVNLTNRRYETSGYVYGGTPYFFPAALRNVFAGLKAEL
jgi:outer membrane receptor protein involved in Fe transport